MEIHIYFEFKESERKPIALALNGEQVGLQTAQFNGKRVFSYVLRNYQNQKIELVVKTLDEDTPVLLTITGENGKTLQKNTIILYKKSNGFVLTIDPLHLDTNKGLTVSAEPNQFIEFGERPIWKGKSSRELKGLNREIARQKASFEFAISRDELLTAKADEPQNTLVEVFYATDRAQKQNKKGRLTYTNSRGDLAVGKCLVNVPGNREKGDFPLPPWYLFGLYSNDNAHMVVKDIQQLNEQDFLSQLKEKVGYSSHKDALLFIHGYNKASLCDE